MSNEKRHGLISTALSVLQPLALSWVAVVILAVLSYVFAASSPMLGDAPWQDAARLGTSIWLLALGAPLGIDGGTVGLMPLVVTVCIWLLCRYFLRSAPVFDWVDVGVAAATAGITAGLLGLFSMPDSFRLVGVLGAMLIVAVSALASWWRHEPPEHRVWSARNGRHRPASRPAVDRTWPGTTRWRRAGAARHRASSFAPDRPRRDAGVRPLATRPASRRPRPHQWHRPTSMRAGR